MRKPVDDFTPIEIEFLAQARFIHMVDLYADPEW
jgi:hypothetical protein